MVQERGMILFTGSNNEVLWIEIKNLEVNDETPKN